MHILQSKLRENAVAIEKYKDRKVKIFHGFFRLWFSGKTAYTKQKDAASIHLLTEALEITKHYKNETLIEFQFIDDLGDEKFSITDFDGEDVYSCTSVTFDNNKK